MSDARSQEIATITLTSVGHALAHIYTLALPAVLLLLKKEFALTDYHAGTLAALLNFTFGLGSLPGGLLVDWLGSKRMLLAFLVGGGLASGGVCLAHSMTGLALGMAVLGLACSLYHPAGLALISRSCRYKGMALGVHGVGGSVGVTLAPIVTGVLAATLGWRSAYIVLGGLGLIAALVVWFCPVGDRPMEAPGAHDGNVPASGPSSTLIVSFLLLCANVIGLSIAFQGSSAFLNMHISQQLRQATLDRAVFFGNLYTSVAMGMGILGQMVGGYVADRTRSEEALIVLAAAGCVPSLVLIGVCTGPLTAAFAMPYAFFYFASQPLYNCLVAKYTPSRWRGAAFGITSFLSFGVGAIGATIGGYTAMLWGAVRWVFPTMAAAAAAASVFGLAMWRLDAARRRRAASV